MTALYDGWVRFAVLGGLLLVAACNDPSGAVLRFESETKFDEVEVFFGRYIGERIPTTPKRPLGPLLPETQGLYERKLSPEDTGERFEPRTTWGYYLPATGDNENLGDYVLAIAKLGGVEVGIGELFDFDVPGDAVNEYHVPLVRFENQELERWGRPNDACIRWTRDRGDQPRSVAVVLPDDSDCDSFEDENSANADCAPLSYCQLDADGRCIGEGMCFDETNGVCASGTCTNVMGADRICIPKTCLDPTLCDKCESAGFGADPAGLLECAIAPSGDGTHLDTLIPLTDDLTLCAEPFPMTLHLGVPCFDPQLLATDYYPVDTAVADKFTFRIEPAAASGSLCQLYVIPPAPGTQYRAIPHLLISVANEPNVATYARTQFVIAIEGRFDPADSRYTCPGTLEQYDITNDLGSCSGL